MKKKIISIIMTICMAVTIVPASMAFSTDEVSAATKVNYSWPTSCHSVSGYWGKEAGHYYPYHYGIDIPAAGGAKVRTAADGKVYKASVFNAYGKCVRIVHADGKVTLYAHLKSYTVKTGQKVTAGQVIGYVGGTGEGGVKTYANHLHFGIYKGTSYLNKEDGRPASQISYNPLSFKYVKTSTSKKYQIVYKDNLSATTNDSSVVEPQTATCGKKITLRSNKFKRSGYSYSAYYLVKYVDNVQYIFCRDKATGKTSKWYKNGSVPSSYDKVRVSVGGTLLLGNSYAGKNIYLFAVWKKNQTNTNTSTTTTTTTSATTTSSSNAKNNSASETTANNTSPKKWVQTGTSYSKWLTTKPAASTTTSGTTKKVTTVESVKAYTSYAYFTGDKQKCWRATNDGYYTNLLKIYSSVSVESAGYKKDTDGSYFLPRTVSISSPGKLGTVYRLSYGGEYASSFTAGSNLGYTFVWPTSSKVQTIYRAKTVTYSYQ